MDEYDEQDEDGEPIPPRRLEKIDLIILPFAFLQQVAEAAAETLDKFVYLLCSHANYKIDKTQFADQVRAEIESIPTTEESR